jgi:hypothetical protein
MSGSDSEDSSDFLWIPWMIGPCRHPRPCRLKSTTPRFLHDELRNATNCHLFSKVIHSPWPFALCSPLNWRRQTVASSLSSSLGVVVEMFGQPVCSITVNKTKTGHCLWFFPFLFMYRRGGGFVGNGVISTQRCQRTTNWQKKTREAHYLFEAVIRNAIIYWSPNHSFGSVTLAMTVEHMSFRGNYCLSLTPGAWLIVSLSTHNHLKKAKLDYVEYQVRVLNKKKICQRWQIQVKALVW